MASESSIYLSEKTFVEPDLCIFREELKSHDVKGSDLLLVIEVADSSLTFDRGTKALLYASHGVRELWVVDAATKVTSVHTGPTGVGWTNVREVLPTETLRAAATTRSRYSHCGSWSSVSAYSAASRACPSRRLSDFTSASAASAITVPGGKIASAPACFSAS